MTLQMSCVEGNAFMFIIILFFFLFFFFVIWLNWPFTFPLNVVTLFVLGLFQTTLCSFQKPDEAERLFHTQQQYHTVICRTKPQCILSFWFSASYAVHLIFPANHMYHCTHERLLLSFTVCRHPVKTETPYTYFICVWYCMFIHCTATQGLTFSVINKYNQNY